MGVLLDAMWWVHLSETFPMLAAKYLGMLPLVDATSDAKQVSFQWAATIICPANSSRDALQVHCQVYTAAAVYACTCMMQGTDSSNLFTREGMPVELHACVGVLALDVGNYLLALHVGWCSALL